MRDGLAKTGFHLLAVRISKIDGFSCRDRRIGHGAGPFTIVARTDIRAIFDGFGCQAGCHAFGRVSASAAAGTCAGEIGPAPEHLAFAT